MTQTLYAARSGSGVTTSDLYTVDPVTAVMSSIGPIGYGVSGLAFDPTTGILYGSTNFPTNNLGQLLTIDTSTGVGTLIGVFPHFGNYHDIAFDASGQLWGLSTFGGSLSSIDKATAVDTEISARSGHFGGGLDFHSGGTLWHVGGRGANFPTGPGDSETLNTSTGVGTHVADMAYLHSGKFDASDTFWASGPGETGSAATELVTVDQTTGVITNVAAFSIPGVGGLAWGPSIAPPGPFTLAAVPSSFTRSPGASMDSTITSTLVSGSPENISLTVDNLGSLPTGVGATLLPTTISDDGGTSNLHITTTSLTPLGSFGVRVKGDDGMGGTATVTVAVHLVPPPPGFHIAS